MKSSNTYYIVLLLVVVGIIATFIIVRKHKSKKEDSTAEITAEALKNYLDEIYQERDSNESGFEYGPDLFDYYIDGDKYPKTAFFTDMVEAYNAYVTFHGIRSVLDEWYRYEEPNEVIKSMQYADIGKLHYEDIKSLISQALTLGQKALSVTPEESDSVALNEFYNQLSVIDSTLANRFNVAKYVNLDENDYWDVINGFRKLRGQTEAQHLKAIKETEDFNLKCKHAMAYVYDEGFYNADLNVLKMILEDGRYSPFIFYIWRIWRCGEQLRNYGPSTWSVIPNKYYNKMRLFNAESTLEYIVNHPDDAIAINQFVVTSAHPNILRCGEFPAGNQSFMEVYYLGLHPKDGK